MVKGATDCHVSGNKFHAGNSASILAIELDEGGAVDSDGNVIRFNEFHSTSSGQLFQVAATGQSDNVVNNNVYNHQGSWGSVEGTVVASLQESRDAWGNGNDIYSTDGSETQIMQLLVDAIENLGTGNTVDTTALAEATTALNTAIENLGPGESVDLSNIPQYGDKQRIGDHEFTLTKAGAGAES